MHTKKGLIESYRRKYSGSFIRVGLKPDKKSKFFQKIIINRSGEPEIIKKGKARKKRKKLD